MKCVNCGKYVERHNLKDAQICLELCSQKLGIKEKNLCKFCKHEIVDGLMIFDKQKKPIAHYSCFRKSHGIDLQG